MKKRGFTLIELIAVIAILAILAVVVVPRVIAYVEKSKKVAIQTEAKVIYNTAEALYSDGIINTKENNFDSISVAETVTVAKDKKNDLLSNYEGFKNLGGDYQTFVRTGDLGSHIVFKGGENCLTLGDLKAIMNTDVNNLKVSSDGKLEGSFTRKNGVSTYNP